MLKTLTGFAASRNLSRERQRILAGFDEEIDIPRLLEDVLSWRHPTGLWFTQTSRTQIEHVNQFAMAPITRRDNGAIVGLLTRVLGFPLTLIAKPSVVLRDAGLEHAQFRTERLRFNFPGVLHTIQFCWERRINP
jgi:hypothetical protein